MDESASGDTIRTIGGRSFADWLRPSTRRRASVACPAASMGSSLAKADEHAKASSDRPSSARRVLLRNINESTPRDERGFSALAEAKIDSELNCVSLRRRRGSSNYSRQPKINFDVPGQELEFETITGRMDRPASRLTVHRIHLVEHVLDGRRFPDGESTNAQSEPCTQGQPAHINNRTRSRHWGDD